MSSIAQYLTPRQIARMLGVSHEKVLRWIHNGELPAVDLSTNQLERPRFKVAKDNLDAFLNKRSVKPLSQPTRRSRLVDSSEDIY